MTMYVKLYLVFLLSLPILHFYNKIVTLHTYGEFLVPYYLWSILLFLNQLLQFLPLYCLMQPTQLLPEKTPESVVLYMHAKSLQLYSTLCDSMNCSPRPPRRLCPWDSPGKNTGVGCHFLLLKKWSVSHSVCPTLCNPMDCNPPGSFVHGILQAKNTGMGSHCLLRRIFQTQGLNQGFLHCR